MIDLNVNGIPAELKNSARWVRAAIADVTKDGKLRKNCKPPYQANGKPAKHNDPKTWGIFADVLTAHEARVPLVETEGVALGDKRGVGYVLGAPFLGIDIDHCVEGDVIAPWVEEWLKELSSYTEFSQSGTGVHVLLHGSAPYPEGHRKDGVECYSTLRYLWITGNRVPDTPEEIRRCDDAEVKRIWERVKTGRSTRVPEHSFTSAKIADIGNRTDHADLSQAVMQVLTLLAIEHICDPVRIESEFKKLKIYTETHWKEKWERLGPGHIVKACEFAREHLQKRGSKGDAGESRKMIVECAHGTVRKPLRFLWPGRLQIGTINHFGGQQGQAKTPIIIDTLARTTVAAVWPDGQPNTFGPRAVLSMSDEDAWDSVWLPRFDLAGGNDQLLYRVRGVEITRLNRDGNVIGTRQGLTALSLDLHLLIEQARQIESLMIILIDPITAYLGSGVKMNEEQSVRDVLTPLSMFAEERGIVVITIGHLNKSESKDPLMRMMGCAAFTGVARVVYSVGSDEEITGKDAKYHHVLAPVRGATEGSLKYHTEMIEKEYSGEKSKVVRVVWDGMTEQTAEDTMNTVSRREQSEITKAARLLRDFLKSGKRTIRECKDFLRDNGYDLDKLKADRVKAAARVDHKKEGNNWYWFLTTGNQETFVIPAGRDNDSVLQF